MTEKRFTYFKSKIGFGKQGIDDNLKGYTFDFTLDNVLDCMNELADENEKLRKEKEDWKSNCLSTTDENSILWNEIAIMREQGAKPSSAFEEYCSKFKGDVE